MLHRNAEASESGRNTPSINTPNDDRSPSPSASSTSSSSSDSDDTPPLTDSMVRLRVLAGPSLNSLTEINVNDPTKPVKISSELFDGSICVHVKGFVDKEGKKAKGVKYFKRSERKGTSWSIQVQGRFLEEISADDILFGNTFDRPLKLPYGSSAALKFMHYIDPSLEHDLSGSKPWALSPFVATMPYLSHARISPSSPPPAFPPLKSIKDDTSTLIPVTAKRRPYFGTPENRKTLKITPQDLFTTDFAYGFIQFYPSLSLDLGMGLSFDLKKYWDGQPVRFVCCERRKDGQPGAGRIFWCVVFDIVTNGTGGEEAVEEKAIASDDVD